MEEKNFVSYEDFGAVGDGVRDDFFAIKNAHDYANENNLPVKGTAGKTYRIHDIVGEYEKAQPVIIRTDTDWTDVNFIIDDRGYYYKDKNNALIFNVGSDYPIIPISEREEIEKVFGGTTLEVGFSGKINWSDYGFEALLIIKNANHKDFIRSGACGDSGQIQSELIVVDKDGNVRENTKIMHKYDDITLVNVYRVDERSVTIKGGNFTQLANDVPMVKEDWGYFGRGLRVFRSNTTIDGLTHVMQGELPGTKNNDLPKGPPYSGFISAVCSTDVTFKNCVLYAKRPSGIAGTYDFQAGTVNNMYLYNVKQSNYYKEDGVTPTLDYINTWGIGGTNYCKNLVYDSCMLSRYDAHCGVYNGKVINSTVCNLELTGGGEFIIENTTFTPISFTPIMLRGDYGCTWEGTITVKNCTVKNPLRPITTFLSLHWNNGYFGYPCVTPDLLIDNLVWDIPEEEILVTNYDNEERVLDKILSDGSENVSQRVGAKYFKVINNNCGKVYKMKKTPMFENTEIEGIELF